VASCCLTAQESFQQKLKLPNDVRVVTLTGGIGEPPSTPNVNFVSRCGLEGSATSPHKESLERLWLCAQVHTKGNIYPVA
jgi:hypothetical protein